MFVCFLKYSFVLLNEKKNLHKIFLLSSFFGQSNNIRESINRRYQLQRVFQCMIGATVYVYICRHSVNQLEDLKMKHFTLFFIPTDYLFDRKSGNMLDEREREKQKNV